MGTTASLVLEQNVPTCSPVAVPVCGEPCLELSRVCHGVMVDQRLWAGHAVQRLTTHTRGTGTRGTPLK